MQQILPQMLAIVAALVLSATFPTRASAEPDKCVPPIILRVAKDASIIYQDQKLSLAELATELKEVKNKAETVVYITAHPDTRTGDVQDIIRRLQGIGFERFTLRAKD